MLDPKQVPELRFPFRLADAFFITLELHRKSEVPSSLEQRFSVEARVDADQFPDSLQVGLRVASIDEDPPFKACIEIVGLFDHIPEQPLPDQNIINDFVNERALYILWSYIEQTIRQTSALMGMPPVKIKNPYHFAVESPESTEPSGTQDNEP
jgi:hypothetical protein